MSTAARTTTTAGQRTVTEQRTVTGQETITGQATITGQTAITGQATITGQVADEPAADPAGQGPAHVAGRDGSHCRRASWRGRRGRCPRGDDRRCPVRGEVVQVYLDW